MFDKFKTDISKNLALSILSQDASKKDADFSQACGRNLGAPRTSIVDLPEELIDKVVKNLDMGSGDAESLRRLNSSWCRSYYRHPWWKSDIFDGPGGREATLQALSRGDATPNAVLFEPAVVRAQLTDWVASEMIRGSCQASLVAAEILRDQKNREVAEDDVDQVRSNLFAATDVYSLPVCLFWALGSRQKGLDFFQCYNLERLWSKTPEWTSLCFLQVTSCPNVRHLPADLAEAKNLRLLTLGWNTGITRLPKNLEKLRNLYSIFLPHGPVFCEQPTTIGRAKVVFQEPIYAWLYDSNSTVLAALKAHRQRATAEGRIKPDVLFLG